MTVKDIVDENFQDYKKPSMFIATAYCNWKCCVEAEIDKSVCQNAEIAKQPSLDVTDNSIVARYLANPLTKAIVIGGLEPFMQPDELFSLIECFRSKTDDDIVVYTGYYKDEISGYIKELSTYKNIIIKYGRFIPNSPKVHDPVLGVHLSSLNQYAEILDI
jgi:organic radical activating enzyme